MNFDTQINGILRENKLSRIYLALILYIARTVEFKCNGKTTPVTINVTKTFQSSMSSQVQCFVWNVWNVWNLTYSIKFLEYNAIHKLGLE